MDEKVRFEAAFRRRITKVSRDAADARSAGDRDVARKLAAKLEDTFDLALRFELDDGGPHLGPLVIPRPRRALTSPRP